MATKAKAKTKQAKRGVSKKTPLRTKAKKTTKRKISRKKRGGPMLLRSSTIRAPR